MNKSLAKELLLNVKEIFGKYKIPFWLDDGTLLGAVRDKDFIDWDKDDVDIGVYKSIFLDYPLWKIIVEEFLKRNIKVVTAWGDSIFSCRKYKDNKNCILDVHTFKKVGKEYHVEMKDILFYSPEEMFDTLDTIDFLGFNFNIPHNSKEYLRRMYGDDWKTPNPNGVIWNSKYSRPIYYRDILHYTRDIPIIDTNKRG